MRRLLHSIVKPANAAIVMVAALSGCAGSPPRQLRIDATHFTPCPAAPHCVSSQTRPGSAHHIAPLGYTVPAATARAALLAVLRTQPNVRIVTEQALFVHATFTTTLGFVDDVTFMVWPQRHIIDVKSASRLGYYDFGVNRARVERLRKQLALRLSRAT